MVPIGSSCAVAPIRLVIVVTMADTRTAVAASADVAVICGIEADHDLGHRIP